MPLEMMLKELRLTAFNQHMGDYQQQVFQNTWSYQDFLARLCEQEPARRFQIRTSNWMRESKLPAGKSFATLNLADAPENTQRAILQLKDNHQWALQADNVLLFGPSGVGKSHIACALPVLLDINSLSEAGASSGYQPLIWHNNSRQPKRIST